ncbi:MAG TPA: tRNA epoxyqueuosine(34) reductase QueG [Limnochordia bacterium]|nr:tRNA epoxyqueuosine(34) reductase QueG [Limnochordia bacterium]
MTLTTRLKAHAASLGIDHLAVAPAHVAPGDAALLAALKADGRYPPFCETDIARRTDPNAILPGAKSIVMVALSYLTDDPAHPPRPDDKPRGWISRYAWGRDYHHILGAKLDALAAFLAEHAPGAQSKPYVDTGPLLERGTAERAGLGWFGKNGMIYVPGHGSWVFLGAMLTTAELDFDPPRRKQCGSCDRCMRACPTGAIIGPYHVDAGRCLSYITQMPGIIPREFRRPMGRMIWGCDICQAACPWNWEAQPTNRPEFRPSERVGARPDLIKLLSITKGEFRAAFGETAMAWRGKKTLQRNACIALGNIKDPRAVEPLGERLQQDANAGVRAAAAWALGEIGGERAQAALAAAQSEEADDAVRTEIAEALAVCARRARQAGGGAVSPIGKTNESTTKTTAKRPK